MTLRLFVDSALAADAEVELDAAASRHVKVRRLQPGDGLVMFDGRGGEWAAQVLRVGRTRVQVRVLRFEAVERELDARVTLAVGMPANERMDALVEKATELGVAAIQPLQCERAVLRLDDERARRRVDHWRAIAAAASGQCGRTRVPAVLPVQRLDAWLAALDAPGARLLLSLDPAAAPLRDAGSGACLLLGGPEGGLTSAEQAQALGRGFVAVSLGPRVLRADTAPLAALAWLGLRGG